MRSSKWIADTISSLRSWQNKKDWNSQRKGWGFVSVSASGCCAISVSLYPDYQKDGDKVIDIEGVPLFVRDEVPEMKWFGLIDYKPKGLHKGFQWKFGRKPET